MAKVPIKASASITNYAPYEIYIRIEGDLPKATNQILGAHWRAKHSNAVKWKRIISETAYAFRPEEILEKAHIRVVRHHYRLLDYDGLVGSLKPAVDSLKGIVIKDDSYKITGPWSVTQEFRSKKQGPLLEMWVRRG